MKRYRKFDFIKISNLIDLKENELLLVKKEILNLIGLDLLKDWVKSSSFDESQSITRTNFIKSMENRTNSLYIREAEKKCLLNSTIIENYSLINFIKLSKEALIKPVLLVYMNTEYGDLISYNKTGFNEYDELMEKTLLNNFPVLEGSSVKELSTTCEANLSLFLNRNDYMDIKIREVISSDINERIKESLVKKIEYSYLKKEDLFSNEREKEALEDLRSDKNQYIKVQQKIDKEWQTKIENNNDESVLNFIINSFEND